MSADKNQQKLGKSSSKEDEVPKFLSLSSSSKKIPKNLQKQDVIKSVERAIR